MTDSQKLFLLLAGWALFFAGLAYGWTWYVGLLKDYLNKF
jgi:hypothetical protein